MNAKTKKAPRSIALKLLVASSLIVGVVTAQTTSRSPAGNVTSAERPALTLTIVPVESVVPVYSAVKLNVTLANTADHEITIPVEINKSAVWMGYYVEVRDKNGDFAHQTRLGRLQYKGKNAGSVQEKGDPAIDPTLITFNAEEVKMKAGETLHGVVEISKLYEFNTPGKYSIRVSRAPEFGSAGTVQSNTVTVVVTGAVQ